MLYGRNSGLNERKGIKNGMEIFSFVLNREDSDRLSAKLQYIISTFGLKIEIIKKQVGNSRI